MDETKELILKAKDGNETALVSLLEAYKPLINSLSKKYSSMCENHPEWSDDFFEEAQIAFYNAIVTYDTANSSITFGAYAKTCIRNKLISFVRKLNAKKRQKAVLDTSCEVRTPQDNVIWRELGEKLFAVAEKTLSPYEKKVLSLCYKGYRAREIAIHVGKSTKSVNNAIFRIRSKLKDTVK